MTCSLALLRFTSPRGAFLTGSPIQPRPPKFARIPLHSEYSGKDFIENNNGYTNVYPYANLIHMKDAAIRIRVEKELHASFTAACQSENRQASDVLREFMRSFADQHYDGRQVSLFATPTMKRLKGSTKHA